MRPCPYALALITASTFAPGTRRATARLLRRADARMRARIGRLMWNLGNAPITDVLPGAAAHRHRTTTAPAALLVPAYGTSHRTNASLLCPRRSASVP